MSWLSKALGLDKKPKLLAEVNKVGDKILETALRATANSFEELAADKDWDAFVQKNITSLAVILETTKLETKNRLLEELIEKLKAVR